ncbi:MAG: hypothetical protein R3C10_01740 [Pirellulales bacterium]
MIDGLKICDFVIAGMEPRHKWVPSRLLLVAVVASVCCASRCADAAGLRAGVAKVDVTNREAGPVNDPLFVKALVLKNDATTAVIVTVDAVAIAEIGSIPTSFSATCVVASNSRSASRPRV